MYAQRIDWGWCIARRWCWSSGARAPAGRAWRCCGQQAGAGPGHMLHLEHLVYKSVCWISLLALTVFVDSLAFPRYKIMRSLNWVDLLLPYLLNNFYYFSLPNCSGYIQYMFNRNGESGHLYHLTDLRGHLSGVFFDKFIDYAITVVPFPPLHSTPSCPPPPSHIPPL